MELEDSRQKAIEFIINWSGNTADVSAILDSLIVESYFKEKILASLPSELKVLTDDELSDAEGEAFADCAEKNVPDDGLCF